MPLKRLVPLALAVGRGQHQILLCGLAVVFFLSQKLLDQPHQVRHAQPEPGVVVGYIAVQQCLRSGFVEGNILTKCIVELHHIFPRIEVWRDQKLAQFAFFLRRTGLNQLYQLTILHRFAFFYLANMA